MWGNDTGSTFWEDKRESDPRTSTFGIGLPNSRLCNLAHPSGGNGHVGSSRKPFGKSVHKTCSDSHNTHDKSCPARGVQCRSCSKANHFAKWCRLKPAAVKQVAQDPKKDVKESVTVFRLRSEENGVQVLPSQRTGCGVRSNDWSGCLSSVSRRSRNSFPHRTLTVVVSA